MDNEKRISLRQKISQKYNFPELLRTGKKDVVSEKIFSLISTFAENEKFNEAGALRDWLIELDPQALAKIIRAAEIIDEAKFTAIDGNHFQTWLPLAKVLSREEFSSLYHSLARKKYASDTVFLRQGTYYPALIFLHVGRVELFTFCSGKETFLTTAETGHIVGGGSFFDPSTWTYSIRSKGVEIGVLTYKDMHRLKKDHPALEAKLGDFCLRFPDPYSSANGSSMGRRAFQRARLDGKTAIALLDGKGANTGRGVSGELFDISRGGISCMIRSSKKSNAVKLFGRKIRATIPLNGKVKAISKEGKVVAVKGSRAAGNEYALHVQFTDHLENYDVNTILQKGKA